jgi:hypothetical protein
MTLVKLEHWRNMVEETGIYCVYRPNDPCTRTCSAHGKMKKLYKILVGKPGGKNPLEDLNVDGKIILKLISGK